MQKIVLAQLFELCAEVGRMNAVYGEGQAGQTEMSEDTRAHNGGAIGKHLNHFSQLGLPMCRLQCERIIAALENPPITMNQFADMLHALRSRMEDETKLVRGLLLSPAETELYDQNSGLFGQSVATRFSTAADDIEEAGKCLALSRGTATVMHLMRVMEVGLKELAKPLGIPYAPSWESYLRQIADRIALPHKKKAPKWKKNEPFFRDVSGDLISVKQAWRNPSMHVVRKYSPEEADEILRAVRRFMQRLADGLPG